MDLIAPLYNGKLGGGGDRIITQPYHSDQLLLQEVYLHFVVNLTRSLVPTFSAFVMSEHILRFRLFLAASFLFHHTEDNINERGDSKTALQELQSTETVQNGEKLIMDRNDDVHDHRSSFIVNDDAQKEQAVLSAFKTQSITLSGLGYSNCSERTWKGEVFQIFSINAFCSMFRQHRVLHMSSRPKTERTIRLNIFRRGNISLL